MKQNKFDLFVPIISFKPLSNESTYNGMPFDSIYTLSVYCQTPVLSKSKRLYVDFVFTLSQTQQSKSEKPHQNLESKSETWY